MKYKNLMAKALYDNVPESPEELAFRKGDILTVIEQNTGGLEGWWLCSLHGRQGIAPGNRLKLLIGPMFEAPSLLQSSPQPPLLQSSTGGPSPLAHAQAQVQGSGAAALYQAPQQSVYQVPPRSALSAENTPSKVVTPSRVGQSYSYSPGQNHTSQDLYDVPPSRAQGVYDVPPGHVLSPPYPALSRSPGQSVYDVPPCQLEPRGGQGVYDVPPPAQGVYSVPPCRTTPNHQESNYDFPQPVKSVKAEGIYDIPPPALTKPTQISSQSVYDYPPPSSNPEPSSSTNNFHNNNEGIYDVPPPALASSGSDIYDIPRGSSVPSRPSPNDSKGIYDVPAPDSRVSDVTDGVNRLSFSSTGSTRSSMSTSSSSTGSAAEGRLILDLDSALQRLYRLQQNVEVAVGNLHTLTASPHWRTFAFMERHANDVRTILDRVRAAVADFVVFGRGAVANATALSDCSLHSKLRRQLARLEDSQQIVIQIYQVLDNSGWAINALATSNSVRHNKTDDLDRFVMVSRTVPDDAKQLASTISANGELLFRRSHAEGSPDEAHPALSSPPSDNESYGKPFPTTNLQDKDNMNHSEQCVKSWMEDYDYVHLQGKEDFERQQKALLDKENIIKQSQVQLGQEQINQFKRLEQEVSKPVENDISQWISQQRFGLTPNLTPKKPDPSAPTTGPANPSTPTASPSPQICSRDKQLLVFYSDQCGQHFLTLLSAMDAFFSCVSSGQPPRIFVAHSKFVILSAHKLVFIGDTLSRQVSTPELANRVMNASNVLCDLLKTVVGATKMAALNYPNTAAIQEMVDRVTELSQHSQQFKEQLLHMSMS
ncbi:enhancer of filamentation 1 isoform X2 [Boleophthalmus pectinirostris]|uniref:enhancer of filamentation 1 isoform X2 n=1 Tax=Boleophthalmus pectinirostris TaxID=150288 RepID=UPI00242BF4E6|nr:enhancer of filamentation 1 isoform X2 [Boleophthalmus pectinirostris]